MEKLPFSILSLNISVKKKSLSPDLKYEDYFHKYIVFIPRSKANYA